METPPPGQAAEPTLSGGTPVAAVTTSSPDQGATGSELSSEHVTRILSAKWTATDLDQAARATFDRFKRGEKSSAVETLRSLATQGSSEAAFYLGQLATWQEPEVLPDRRADGPAWFVQAADRGHPLGILQVSLLASMGLLGPDAKARSGELFQAFVSHWPYVRERAESGCVHSQYYVANVMLGLLPFPDLSPVPRAPEKGVFWLERARAQAIPSAAFRFAIESALASALVEVGEPAKGAQVAEDAVSVAPRLLATEGPAYAQFLFLAGRLNAIAGKHDRAKPLLEQAVAILEATPDHPSPLLPLARSSLAISYVMTGQGDQAEVLLAQALEPTWNGPSRAGRAPDGPIEMFDIAIENQLRDDPEMLRALTQMGAASAYLSQGDLSRAEQYARAATETMRRAKHPRLGDALVLHGSILLRTGDAHTAEPVLKEAYATMSKAYPGDDLALLPATLAIATAMTRSDPKAAELKLVEVVEAANRRLGPESDTTIEAHYQLGEFYWGLGDQRKALRELERAAAGIQAQDQHRRLSPEAPSSPGGGTRHNLKLTEFQAATVLASTIPADERWNSWGERIFEAMQLSQENVAGEAVSMMAARVAADSPEIEALVRQREQAALDRGRVEYQIAQIVATPPSDRKEPLDLVVARSKERSAAIEDLDRQIAARFPRYEQLMHPSPASIPTVQSSLKPDEALVALHFPQGFAGGIGWVVRKTGAIAVPLKASYESLSKDVVSLRKALRADTVANLGAFDVQLSHEVYRQTIEPLLPSIGDAKDVLVVTDGPLSSLPLSVLVAALPDATSKSLAQQAPANYRNVQWLGQRFNLSVLPTVGSLPTLRATPKSSAAKPFVGFGDPLLGAPNGAERGVSTAVGGPVVDVAQLRALPGLPETANELKDIARTLNAEEGAVYLQEEATERQVKGTKLHDRKVIAFATHAAVSGQLGQGEPGLVLTPPKVGSELDDGYLKASEVARLHLDADWVVLSACNTAAGDVPDAAGLSGLAKAFLYAGARAALVSHWPIDSAAATALTTTTFARWNDGKGRSRAEALRLAQEDLFSSKEHPEWAHPFYWAPFSLVGDGSSTADH